MTKVLAAALTAMTVLTLRLEAQRGRALVEEGNRLYDATRFDEAHEKYLDALREAPESELIRFNDGNALYKSQDYRSAVESYRAAVEAGDSAMQARAWYNIGNALFKQRELQAGAEAFKQALRLEPDDGDAKHNLERVIEQQQQQRQQNQQNNESENQDSDSQPQPKSGDQEQDQGEDRTQDQPRSQPDEDESNREQERQPQERPAQMSPEEAERLLQAIQEDPSKIERRRKATSARRRPSKEW